MSAVLTLSLRGFAGLVTYMAAAVLVAGPISDETALRSLVG
jgi:hypothetical protein